MSERLKEWCDVDMEAEHEAQVLTFQQVGGGAQAVLHHQLRAMNRHTDTSKYKNK